MTEDEEREEVENWARRLVAGWELPSGEELAKLRRILRAPTSAIEPERARRKRASS